MMNKTKNLLSHVIEGFLFIPIITAIAPKSAVFRLTFLYLLINLSRANIIAAIERLSFFRLYIVSDRVILQR